MRSYDKQVMDLALEAGEILLDAGAEIFRVEETMRRIAKSYGIEKSNTFVMSTGIILSAENKGEEMYAHVKHIPINSARLYKVAAVNQLSREIEEGKYTLEEAKVRLQEIRVMPGKRDVTRILAAGVGSGSFGYVLGGGVSEMIASGLAGLLLFFFLVLLEKREKKTSKIVVNIIGGFLATLFSAIFFRMGIGNDMESILVGSIMPLVPGVSFVNSIRDFADGDYIGGAVRMMDAILVAMGISLGVGMMYFLHYQLMGGALL